jgi:hypothetical protein
MGLRKIIKKARKALHVPALTLGNVVKVGAGLASGGVGGLGAAAIASKLRSHGISGIKQVVRSKGEKALHDRLATLIPNRQAPNTAAPADTRPGGAALRAIVRKATRRARRASSRPVAAAKRRAPTGGLDLKALSASWKAAGKPGTWMDWIRSHR